MSIKASGFWLLAAGCSLLVAGFWPAAMCKKQEASSEWL